MKMTIGKFLLLRLRQIGVRHVFGVPGDFNLQLLEQFNEVDDLEFIGTCNELNAAYAADGYARINGISAVLTTYGVGDLSAICGLAGACAEHIPIVLLSGTPPLFAIESRLRMHHSLAEGNFDNISICLQQFTCGSVRLTPANTAEELDRVLLACCREKMPVHIQIPSNITYLEIDVPEQQLRFTMPASDTERLNSAVKHITRLLEQAQHPLLLIDAEVERCGLADYLYSFAVARQIPYLEFRTGKGIMPEEDPLYLGLYNGKASNAALLEAWEQTDCLIATAPSFQEASPMVSPHTVPAQAAVYIRANNVTVEGEVYEGVGAEELVRTLVESVYPLAERPAEAQLPPLPPYTPPQDRALSQKWLWQRLQHFLRRGDLVCAENGTSAIAVNNLRFPNGLRLLGQPLWGAIGYTLPALLGAMTAEPERRSLLFIGDGSFQISAQEWSTLLHRGLKPIIFLLNNKGYTIERYILGMESAYNDIANWRYAELARVFAEDRDCYSVSVSTELELEQALAVAADADRACFIELQLAKQDAPAEMKLFGALTAELDYGPRGPQRKHAF